MESGDGLSQRQLVSEDPGEATAVVGEEQVGVESEGEARLEEAEEAESPEGPDEEEDAIVLDRSSPTDDGPPAKIARTSGRDDVSDRQDASDRKDVSDRPEREEDGETCSICLDSWSNSGPHRLVCLKCGHLFGYECLARWLKSLPMKQRVCPTCKARAGLRDIRYVYARRLVAVDTGELDELRAQLESARAERGRAEQELHQCRLGMDGTLAELNRLRSLVQGLKSEPPAGDACRWRLSLDRTLDVAADGSCRVLAYNCRKYELYASHKSTLNLFPGFGVRKIDCVNQKVGKFIYLHPKVIRDVRYSSLHDLALSVSLDKTARLTCGRTEQPVTTIRTERPLWSCCWSVSSCSQLLVGGEGGICLLYDMRNPDVPVQRLVADDCSPVVSAASTTYGYLVAHLNSCRLYKPVGSDFECSTLPIEGPFLSLSYDEPTKQLLVSCRPSAAHPFSRHAVASLADGGCRLLHTHAGSRVQSLMSRSCQLRLRDQLWAAAHSESDAAVEVYSGGDLGFRRMQRLSAQEPIVDMQSIDLAGEPLLAALSPTKLRLYRATVF